MSGFHQSDTKFGSDSRLLTARRPLLAAREPKIVRDLDDDASVRHKQDTAGKPFERAIRRYAEARVGR